MVRFSSQFYEVFIDIFYNTIMPFYSFEMILVGIILLSGMAAGGIKLWLKRRSESVDNLELNDDDAEKQNLDPP